jgi:putative tryptophan/tyrosine transport system substrate-binding protein
MMKRREFITLLVGGATAWPLAVRGQQSALPVVGFLNGGSAAVFSELAATFRQGLDEAGYVEGRNVIIEHRWAEGRYDRLPALVADLLNRRVAVIASTGGPAVVEAAAAATTTVPIVFVSSDIILKTGVITSLNRPSRNLTGVVMSTSALLSKCLQFLDELVPKDATIGILVNPNVSNTDEDKEKHPDGGAADRAADFHSERRQGSGDRHRLRHARRAACRRFSCTRRSNLYEPSR